MTRREEYSPSPNWPYVWFAIAIFEIMLASLAVGIHLSTTDSEDWRTSTFAWIAYYLAETTIASAMLTLPWKIFSNIRIEITRDGIWQDRIIGSRIFIPWSDVRRLKRVGFGFHIHSTRSRIDIAPYIYKKPHIVIAEIITRTEKESRSMRKNNANQESIDSPLREQQTDGQK